MRHAVILAGGQGRRFWPRSRRSKPKQFMPFDDGRSLLQVTSDRLVDLVPIERQWVITNRQYVAQVRKELPALPLDQIIGEPRGLNTAPAIAIGAALMRARDPHAVMMVQAADHWVRDLRRFRVLGDTAFRQIEKGPGVALIGFQPVRAATGYGYIELGAGIRSPRRGVKVSRVASFREKPPAAVAKRYFMSGRYLWNGCMFFWSVDAILAGIARHLPLLGRGLDRFAATIAKGGDVTRAIQTLYRGATPISIEHGVVEHLEEAYAITGDCGWEDVGTWNSLAGLLDRDANGNVVQGTHLGLDTTNSVILSDTGVVATIGVKDLIIVRDGDAVLVLPRSREDEIRGLIDLLESDQRLRDFL